MCHGYEWEVMKQAYMEQLKRKERERDEAQRKQGGKAAPAKPAESDITTARAVPPDTGQPY